MPADPLEDARNGSTLCANTLGGPEDLPDRLFRVGIEVGDEQLHAAPGRGSVDLGAGLRVQPGAAVGQVVTRHPGDRGVTQAHRRHRVGHPARLPGVQRFRLAGGDLAEVAAPGAGVAADQEGGLAVLPALEDVRAAGFLADGVQALAPDQRLELLVFRAHLCAGLDPRRLALDRRLGIADLETQEFATFRRDCHYVNATTRRPSSASHTASATGAITSATEMRRPSSAVSEVTPASEMPHGTIDE